MAQLLDSYLEKTLGGVEDEEKVKKENGENGADVPYASLRSPAAVEHFRLFRDSRPGRIGLASKRRRLPDVEEGEEESSSDEERLERVRSVVVDAPAPVEKKPA